ncbi:MAG: cation-translocating P-type ATPase, partial [Candidatus Thorarchaeota archaeon]
MIQQEESQDLSWHALDTKDILKILKARLTGLTTEEANERLNTLGYNEIEVDKKKAKLLLLIAQFKNPIILILFAAALISLIANKLISAYVIFIVIIFNSLIGFFQEYKAEKSLEALKSMSAPEAEVIRDCTEFGGCTEKRIKAREIVSGDIVLLDSGDIVPADARLHETINLEIDESVLTGESLPVLKHVNTLEDDLIVAERKNMVFSGTVVTKGRGKAIVVNTGINTELGKISQLLKETEKIKTPLQKRISRLGIFLALLAVIFSSIVFIFGVLRGFEVLETFLFALSTMVSAIPEGLPAAISIALAIGVNIMAKRNAIVKKIQAIDTIGAVSVICTDKTGTLTTNQITAREILIDDNHISITGVGFTPEGIYEKNGEPINVMEIEQLKNFLEIITLCNDSRLRQHETDSEYVWEIYGDPTEGSLIVASHKTGMHKEMLEEKYPRIDEIPFTSEEKYMATFHESNNNIIKICVKGAPERILNRCQKIIKNDSIKELTPDEKRTLFEQSNLIASRGLRVLGVAYQEIQRSQLDSIKRDILQEKSNLVMMGFIGMIDPPRPEVKTAIKTCNNAGIEVKMITGDHALTAKAIGKEIGVIGDDDKVITGLELDHLTESELDEIVEDTSIFARVSPLHKFQIVSSLQKKG